MKRSSNFFITGLVGLITLGAANVALGVQISTNLPGPNPASAGPGGFVANFYQFALWIGGVLAFGAIVYGGVKYTLAAGNPGGQTEGKELIKGALLGLLLLAGAYIILRTINPDIVSLSLPTPQRVQVQPPPQPPQPPPPPPQPPPPPGSNTVTTCTGVTTCGGDPQHLCNGTCPSGQTCAPVSGRRQCVSATVISNACSNSNPNGTCTDPNARCTNVNGVYQCVSTATRPPACRGIPQGGCVYVILNPAPAGCTGQGSRYVCPNTPPATSQSCFQRYNC